ncbi:hypothetical protein ASG43_19895 [Aureimonas sp. Leaf454]|uniref:hypothetical protein n=1 Tax=Aureimonas sp. Leaf454 TaxID=1736381 RepID=UPI0006F378FB|nr:hypothetical protein [Aureimonas sp. Leaf454]KQT52704.1 hypothetical protein ASG43_19895 [Aureimonas sp. Leaf454]
MSRPDTQTRDTLWTLITAPTVWAVHFVLCYVFAAYECAPNDAIFQPIEVSRYAIAGFTLVALVIIGYVGLRGLREWRSNEGSFPHADDTPEDRERFLEFSSVLLAALSFIAVLFVALPALLLVDCR